MSKLIGFGGRLAAGKDAMADYLVEEHGWIKLNMSAPLHDAMMALNPWILTQTPISSGQVRYVDLVERVGYTAAKENPEVRRLLQALGTEVGRNMFGENVWVDIANHNISELRSQGFNVAITGIRFPNEIKMIKENKWHLGSEEGKGGTLVWVERPGMIETADYGSMLKHVSEIISKDEFDMTIINDGTLEDLYAQAEAYLA